MFCKLPESNNRISRPNVNFLVTVRECTCYIYSSESRLLVVSFLLPSYEHVIYMYQGLQMHKKGLGSMRATPCLILIPSHTNLFLSRIPNLRPVHISREKQIASRLQREPSCSVPAVNFKL